MNHELTVSADLDGQRAVLGAMPGAWAKHLIAGNLAAERARPSKRK
jgi:hypothetical protein